MSIARFINRAWSRLVDWAATPAATMCLALLIVAVVVTTLIVTNRP